MSSGSSLRFDRRSLAVVLAALLVLLAAGCDGAAGEVDLAESDFAVMNVSVSGSILPDLENTHGAPPVCIGLLGFDPRDRAAAAARTEALIVDAAVKWNALLRGNAQWSLQTDAIAPSFSVQDTECPKTGPGFNVNVWATAEGFKADYCSRPGYTCVSGAMPAFKSLYLGPWNRRRAADALDPFMTLHEYGHLLGLGDTYRIPGMNDWAGEQPASVMSGRSYTLTEDDKLGLWVTLRTLKSGSRSCDGFGNEVAMTNNDWDNLLCSPDAEPKLTHGGPKEKVAPVLPNAGTWAYEGYPVANTGIVVSDVIGSPDGFVMTLARYSNGELPQRAGTRYQCDAAGACAATIDAQYRVLVASATSMRLITPSAPAGVQLDYAPP